MDFMKKLDLFFVEDAPSGDVTSRAIFESRVLHVKAQMIAKQDLILSGIQLSKKILKKYGVNLKTNCTDGDFCPKGSVIADLKGDVQKVLLCERLILNILQHMSGIATLTNEFVRKANQFHVKILDTRKTLPGLRDIEKLAVKHGGGHNHRMSLSDQYLIKDNHIEAAGSITLALQKVYAHRKKLKKKPHVEIEVKNLKELQEALILKPHIVMLDNMRPSTIKKAVELRNQIAPKVELEISGGITLKSIDRFLPLGVERISIGALTHSVKAADISLLI